jgi:tRNA (guanosine-2'-O-)-methyltransferase
MATREREERIRRAALGRRPGAVVLEDVHDPHNAAAVLRSCDAFGIQRVHFVFRLERAYNPRQVGKQSSSSANKWLDFTIHASIEACLEQLHAEGYETVAAVVEGGEETLFESRFGEARTAFLFGNEHRGLSEEAVRGARRRVCIPMAGMVESLNLSVTAGIFLFELTRQRRAEGASDCRLAASEYAELIASFGRRAQRRRGSGEQVDGGG